jgi:hypothetical protein
MSTLNRRHFFKAALAGLVALPFIPSVLLAKLPAGLKGLTASFVKRNGYVDAISKIDAENKKHKKFKVGEACGNCKQYKNSKEKEGYAPCKVAGNKYAAKMGWCKQYRVNKKITWKPKSA